MSATFHLPATPLPWRESPDGVVSGRQNEMTVAKGVRFLDDRAYIVHSAKAYPSLVAKLKRLENVARLQGADVDPGSAVADAVELLRELGEAP